MVILIRGRLVVGGNVQGVGYRVVVRQIARRNRIRGKVKNLDDGSVEIYCEGEDKDSVLKFIEAIEVKSKDDNISEINVETIQVFWEGYDGYIPLEGSIKNFKIDYDAGTASLEQVNLERLETGSLMMYAINEKLSITHSDFGELDNKYDKVSQKLDAINNNITHLVDRLGIIIDRFVDDRTTKENQN